MDSLFALKGHDFVLVAGESTIMQSIFKLKPNFDKSIALDTNILLAMAGEHADREVFGPFIQRNIQYFKFKNGIPLTVEETANFTRTKLAEGLRKQPYHVSSIVAGVDRKGPQIYWLDYMGTMSEVPYGAHGYAAYFVSSVLSNAWKPNLTREQAVDIVKMAIHELRTRFMIAQDNFIVKLVDANGIQVIN